MNSIDAWGNLFGQLSFTGLSANLATDSDAPVKLPWTTAGAIPCATGIPYRQEPGAQRVITADATNDWISVSEAGYYRISANFHLGGIPVIEAHRITAELRVAPGNTTFVAVPGTQRKFQGVTDATGGEVVNEISFAIDGIFWLSANDRVAVYILNEDATGENVVPSDGIFTVVRVA